MGKNAIPGHGLMMQAPPYTRTHTHTAAQTCMDAFPVYPGPVVAWVQKETTEEQNE